MWTTSGQSCCHLIHHVLEGGWQKLPEQPAYHQKPDVFCFRKLMSLLRDQNVDPKFQELRDAERAIHNASLPVRDFLMRRRVSDHLERVLGLPRVLCDIVSQYLSPLETVGYGFPCHIPREPHPVTREIVDRIDAHLQQYRNECRLRQLRP